MTRQLLRVLIVEDAADDVELLLREIQRGGYEVTYDQVQTAAAMRAALDGAAWDLVISDYNMPGFTAPDALKVLQSTGQDLPFIIVSGTIGEEAAVTALQAGAADFLVKGHLARLLPAIARVRQGATTRSEGRRVIEALHQVEAQHRTFVDGAVLGICQTAADGRLLAVNPALVTMLGYGPAAELLAIPLPDLFTEAAARLSVLQQVKERARFSGVETLWQRKAGESIHVRLSGWGCEAAGRPVTELIVEDVTEWHQRQDRTWQAQRVEAAGQLTADLAHDFTDPLTAILGFGELLTEQIAPDAPGGKDLREMVVGAERAAVLARQLLAVSRQQPIALVPLNLNDVIQTVAATLPRMLGQSIQIKTVLARDLGPVMAGPGQIEQILVNLAVKARGAMPDGGVLTIESRASAREAEFRAADPARNASEFVLVRVSDTGIGPASKAFTRAGGLDVAAVSSLVTQIGGAMHIESDAGRGTAFQIYLRKADRPVRVAPVPAAAPTKSGQETVLLVEDEDHVRAFVRAALLRQEYTVLEAPSAERALELLAEFKQPVHLLLTDIVLGGMDGRQLAARVSSERPYIHTLLMSGYLDRPQPQSGAGGPAAPILEKPFTARMLIQRVREALGQTVSAAR